jgi:hypothetical protein
MKTIFAGVLLAACASTVYAQTGGPRGPLVQLIDDVHAAIPRAHLGEIQRGQLHSAEATLEAVREARLQGQGVNRMKAAGALKDLQNIVDSGAFDSADQQKIDADVEAVRSA